LTAVEGTLRDGFHRASQILDLAASELKTDRQKAVEFSNRLISYSTRFQGVSTNAVATMPLR
jgi:hypothetical protein